MSEIKRVRAPVQAVSSRWEAWNDKRLEKIRTRWEAKVAPMRLTASRAPGAGIVIIGKTYEHRDALKEMGVRWDKEAKAWAVPVERLKRGQAARELTRRVVGRAPRAFSPAALAKTLIPSQMVARAPGALARAAVRQMAMGTERGR